MPELDPPVTLAPITLPDFGEALTEPSIPPATYQARVAATLARARQAGLDALIVYGDREHSANIAWLTGYDPRFEEALLILVAGRQPQLLVGNEGWAYATASPGSFERVLFQSFSLLGQPRGSSLPLPRILADAGIAAGQRIGTAGWKYFDASDGLSAAALEIPTYIAEAIRGISADVTNANHLFMAADGGLRTLNDADQLAVFEYAATSTSRAVANLLHNLAPGLSERACARLLGYDGIPLSAHLMLSSGPRATLGLPSPSARVIAQGEPFTVAYGVWGALNARAGFLVHGPDELAPAIRDYVPKLVEPYFSAIVAWYETLAIGVTGDALFQAIQQRIGDPFFGVGLNPGHLIHLDEWLHSPIYQGSQITLKSGMALQVDVIPATHSPWFTTNIEDGIALADAGLRAEIAARHPEAWARIQARRTFMGDVLGIRLAPEVLPFSSIPAWLPPYLLSPHLAMRVNRPS